MIESKFREFNCDKVEEIALWLGEQASMGWSVSHMSSAGLRDYSYVSFLLTREAVNVAASDATDA